MGKNIDQITNTAVTLVGTDRIVVRTGIADPSGDLDAKSLLSTLATYMASGVLDSYVNGLAAAAIATARRGTIQLWGAAAAPTGALLCDGQAVSRTTYAALFAIYGTTFGAGDGSTTFNVPNFQGVVPKGVGSQDINGRTKTGPALGVAEEDRMHGHRHNILVSAGTGAVRYMAIATNGVAAYINALDGQRIIDDPVSDGTNGAPRTGATTRENSLGINFIVWY